MCNLTNKMGKSWWSTIERGQKSSLSGRRMHSSDNCLPSFIPVSAAETGDSNLLLIQVERENYWSYLMSHKVFDSNIDMFSSIYIKSSINFSGRELITIHRSVISYFMIWFFRTCTRVCLNLYPCYFFFLVILVPSFRATIY